MWKNTFVFVILCGLIACSSSLSEHAHWQFKGLSFVGVPYDVTNEMCEQIKLHNANCVALMPFGYGKMGSGQMTYKNLKWQWKGESYKGVSECIGMAHSHGVKVMIKPQLWFDWGSFTGDFELEDEGDWKAFESTYSAFILDFARLAEEKNVEMLCIGTELKSFINARPSFWNNLIRDVRSVYKGSVTYAANWDNYNKVPFWDKLDFIGIDAYFPLSENETPSVEDIVSGWKPVLKEMQMISEQNGKPVIFTEWGFRSMPFCAFKPWETERSQEVNLQGQVNAYEGTFLALEDQPWFSGGFVWKWFPDHSKSGGKSDNRFTPQNKPSEEVLSSWFECVAN